MPIVLAVVCLVILVPLAIRFALWLVKINVLLILLLLPAGLHMRLTGSTDVLVFAGITAVWAVAVGLIRVRRGREAS